MYPYTNSKNWVKNGMKKVRKEQRHCLRFKRYKNKQSFCFIKAVLMEYPWGTVFSFVLVVCVGLATIVPMSQWNKVGKYFGGGLQTSLISNLEAKIRNFQVQIADRKKCTEDQYWTEATGGVCNYWLYNQENSHCAKFGVDTKRIAIGTKICCNPLESVVYDGPEKNVTACPGSDIFFSRNATHDATLVADISGCRAGVCQFYPADDYVIKFDTQGKIARGKEGKPLIIKPCTVKRKVGSCDKDCGSGQRTVSGIDMYCNEFSMKEMCNTEPCFTETIVN